MPQVVIELMRDESIDTTTRFYVGRNAQATADVLWEAHKRAKVGNAVSSSPEQITEHSGSSTTTGGVTRS